MNKFYDSLIKRLIEVGRSEIIQLIPDSEFSYFREGKWLKVRNQKDCDKFSYEELKALFKGIVLCAKQFDWQEGSLNISWIFLNLIERPEYSENYDERKEIYEFGFANKIDNPYVSEDSGLNSTFKSYEEYLNAKIEAEIEQNKRSSRMRQVHLESKRLATVRKEFEAKAKEKRMRERAERKKERDRNISIIEYN